MNHFTITITNNENLDTHTFNTDCAIFSAQSSDSTNVHQSVLAHNVNTADLTTVLSGCINSYLRVLDSPESLAMVEASVKVAIMKLAEQKLFGVDNA